MLSVIFGILLVVLVGGFIWLMRERYPAKKTLCMYRHCFQYDPAATQYCRVEHELWALDERTTVRIPLVTTSSLGDIMSIASKYGVDPEMIDIVADACHWYYGGGTESLTMIIHKITPAKRKEYADAIRARWVGSRDTVAAGNLAERQAK